MTTRTPNSNKIRNLSKIQSPELFFWIWPQGLQIRPKSEICPKSDAHVIKRRCLDNQCARMRYPSARIPHPTFSHQRAHALPLRANASWILNFRCMRYPSARMCYPSARMRHRAQNSRARYLSARMCYPSRGFRYNSF